MKSEFVKIEQGNIALRIIALIMDAVLAFFVFLGLAGLVMTPIANKAFGYQDIQASQFRYQIATHLSVLYEADDEQNIKTIYTYKDYAKINNDTKQIMLYEFEGLEGWKKSQVLAFYKERIQYYYCNFRTGYNIEVPKGYKAADFTAPNYKKYSPAKYTEEWFNNKIWKDVTKLDDAKQKALDATKDFYYQDYYQDGNNSLKRIQLFLILPSYVLSFSIFFIIIPLCFKNGETLGKKAFHLGLLAKDGYAVKKRQIILRQFALLLYCGLSSFIIGIGVTSVATLFIAVFIYFVATMISKTKRSPFDYLAYTIVVDTQKSVWYKDEFEEAAMTKEFDENMKKYRKEPVQGKNVIQVGSKIVKEDIRKEVEESKQTENIREKSEK